MLLPGYEVDCRFHLNYERHEFCCELEKMTIDTMFRQTDFYNLPAPPGPAGHQAMHEPSKVLDFNENLPVSTVASSRDILLSSSQNRALFCHKHATTWIIESSLKPKCGNIFTARVALTLNTEISQPFFSVLNSLQPCYTFCPQKCRNHEQKSKFLKICKAKPMHLTL